MLLSGNLVLLLIKRFRDHSMANRYLTLISGATLAGLSFAAQAQTPFDGLYQPTGYNWSCSADFLGLYGGAVGIVDGYLEGVENRCELTSPRPSRTGTGITYTALCNGEGTEYREQVTISKTDIGVNITRGGDTISWSRCGSSPQKQTIVPDGQWGFSDQHAYVVSGRNQFSLSCAIFNPSSTYATASMSVPCPLCFPREVTKYTLRVDDRFEREYRFERVSNAEGSVSDLDRNPRWYDGLIPALMAGSVLEVIEQGNVIATFPLTGSSRAIGHLRKMCN